MTEPKREEKKKRERWRLEKLEEKEEEEKRGKKAPLSFPPLFLRWAFFFFVRLNLPCKISPSLPSGRFKVTWGVEKEEKPCMHEGRKVGIPPIRKNCRNRPFLETISCLKSIAKVYIYFPQAKQPYHGNKNSISSNKNKSNSP